MTRRLHAIDFYDDERRYTIHGSDQPSGRRLWDTVDQQAKLLSIRKEHLRGLVNAAMRSCAGIVALEASMPVLPHRPGDPWPWMVRELASFVHGTRRRITPSEYLAHRVALRRALPAGPSKKEIRLTGPEGILAAHAVAFGYADEWFPTIVGADAFTRARKLRRRLTGAEFFAAVTGSAQPCRRVLDALDTLPRTKLHVLRCVEASLQIPEQARPSK